LCRGEDARTGKAAPHEIKYGRARGLIRLHRAWDDTTVKTRISPANGGQFRLLIVHFDRVN